MFEQLAGSARNNQLIAARGGYCANHLSLPMLPARRKPRFPTNVSLLSSCMIVSYDFCVWSPPLLLGEWCFILSSLTRLSSHLSLNLIDVSLTYDGHLLRSVTAPRHLDYYFATDARATRVASHGRRILRFIRETHPGEFLGRCPASRRTQRANATARVTPRKRYSKVTVWKNKRFYTQKMLR